MTYATWISQLRSQSGDVKRRVHIDWTGDGSTTVFQMPVDTYPVYDDSDTILIKVNGTTQNETTNYTLDKSSGTITFVSGAPTNGHAITMDSIAVHLLNADFLQVTNDVIKSLGDDFFKEFVDDTNFTATAEMLSLDLTGSQPNCIAVYAFQTRHASSENWTPVEEAANWRYDRENNKIYVGIKQAFPTTGDAIRIRGLKTYSVGAAITDTLDVQDRFLTVLEYGCLARYWRWRFKNVVELVSKMTQENTRTPLQELIMLADRFDRLYEVEKAKLKPAKPPKFIPPYKEGGGRP